ncbi:hypothetical protein PPERSA_03692 [Pseudocohnilembus persalinus]|uniref:Uncharacterized protein n=1 Tax=Pseudocohnilembus persalinus TaxID=266149 RepID=A0A0V0QG55_PSEPJ|nr:hypothetical protein PPERSA_03692 [Pseudocohnilembus persalinus]|eukprot:KRX01188.1 hypothetical protein PPERSA_03692 [Pseudocohnilembus persalinus]
MYTRKWTRMNYFDSVKMFKKYGLINNYDPVQRAFHLFPLQQYERDLLNNTQKRDSYEVEQKKQDQKLIKKLLQRYPDLKYEPINQSREGQPMQTKNYVLRFIEKQKQFMINGFKEDLAFKKTEQLFQDRIQRKIDSLQITEGLAASNRARSFMNYYQQQAEYESRVKVLRMKRDLSTYEQELAQFQNEMENFSKNKDQSLINQQQELEEGDEDLKQNSEQDETIYQRVLYDIQNKGQKNRNDQSIENLSQQEVEEFLQRTRNIFNSYYQRAAYSDKLSNLTDQEIKAQIRDSPKKIKKRSQQLLNKLEKFGVQLNDQGEIDFSSIPYPHLRKQLESNPAVKIALLQKQLDFEFPHKEHMRNKAQELSRRLSQIEVDSEQAKNEKQKIIKHLQQEYSQENSSLNQENDSDAKNIQKSLETDYLELQKQYNEKQLKNNQNSAFDNSQDVLEENERQKSEFLQDSEIPISSFSAQTYKLFETYEERQLRVEAKYIQQKLAEIQEETNLFEQDGEQEAQQQSEINYHQLKQQQKLLDETIQQFRRLKFRLEQKNLQNAKQLLFEEHEVFDPSEILIDEEVPYEKLEQYLRTPRDERINNEDQEIQDLQIQEMIKQKTVREDLVPQGAHHMGGPGVKMVNSDTLEEIAAEEKRRGQRKIVETETIKAKQESEQNIMTFSEEADNMGSKKSQQSQKQDKKSLLEFIKKANKKKVNVGKVTRKLADIRKEKKEGKKGKK